MLNTPVTPPRVPIIDPRTNLIDRAWYMFFVSLSNTATAVVDNPDVGPSPESLIASYDAALQALAQEVGTQPVAADMTAELVKQIEAVGITDTGLLSMIAEIQKQIDALNSAPPPAQGTVTAVTATAPISSSGGTAPNITLDASYGDTQNPYAVKTANYVLAGPTTGAAALPTFRALVAADIPALPYGTGTVTSVSVVSANGFTGTVATATTTPAITLTTSITGVLKGNGTAISAAVVNTDYFAPSAPVTKTADFTVAATDVWLINNKSGSTCTATLPTASSWSGRVLRFQNYQTQTLVSASSNVVPLAGGAAGTSILLASAGDSATLVSDGSNWLMTQYVPNNILLLE